MPNWQIQRHTKIDNQIHYIRDDPLPSPVEIVERDVTGDKMQAEDDQIPAEAGNHLNIASKFHC